MSIIQSPFSIQKCQTTNITIRNFLIAVDEWVASLLGGTLRGPLVGAAKEPAVAQYVAERGNKCHLEEPQHALPASLRMLWGTLVRLAARRRVVECC